MTRAANARREGGGEADAEDAAVREQSRGISTLVATIVGNTDKLSKIKLDGGLAGKSTRVQIAVAVSCAMICVAVHGSETVAIVALSLLAFVVLALQGMLLSFAKKNPHAALLEGAEFLLHERIQRIGMKGAALVEASPEHAALAHSMTVDARLLESAAAQPDPTQPAAPPPSAPNAPAIAPPPASGSLS